MKRNHALVAVLAAIVSAGIATAAMSGSFTQTFPQVEQLGVFGMCDPMLAAPDYVGNLTPGHAFFTCAYPWHHAFHAHPNVTAIPRFNPGAIGTYTDFYIVPRAFPGRDITLDGADASACVNIAGAVEIFPYTNVTFPGGSDKSEWDYCLEYASAQTLPKWTIDWYVP